MMMLDLDLMDAVNFGSMTAGPTEHGNYWHVDQWIVTDAPA